MIMPNFIREILLSILGYAWVALLGGIGIVGFGAYSHFKAASGTAYVAQDQLTKLSGKVTEAAEITVESKRRRGGSRVSDKYYEISVKPDAGEMQKLRIHLTWGQKKVEDIIDEKIDAAYDSNDNNIVYSIASKGQELMSYEQSKARLQASAEAQAKSFGGGLILGGGVLLAVIGAAGMFLRRRVEAGSQVAAA
jgi:hypothetical protein